MHPLKRKAKNRNFKVDWRVGFYKEVNSSTNLKIHSLRAIIRSDASSSTIKKKAKYLYNKSLIFKERSYRRFLIRYQRFVYLALQVDISDCLGHVIKVYEEMSISNGPTYAVKLFKQLYDICLRLATSNSFTQIPYLKSNSRGEPEILGPLLPLLKGKLHERKAALSSILIIKLVRCWDDDFSIKTISKEAPIEMRPLDAVPEIGNYFERYIERFGANSNGVDLNRLRTCYLNTLQRVFPSIKREDRLSWISRNSSIHVSGRNGPNGPSLTTAVIDHSSLTSSENGQTSLYQSIKEMSKLTNNKSLNKLIESFEDEDYKIDNLKGSKPINSRLSIKDESWAKRRVFAICDYFSQSSLKGLHTYLFRWLEAQSEDGTFNQDRVSELVRTWTTDPDPLMRTESADLSAATDSIPVEIQAEIVSQICGTRFAQLWRRICCDRNFKIPNSTNTISYKTGQPMGLLSSWAMLAVWHHIMCRTCLAYLGITRDVNNPRFVIIGDDVAMRGNDLFKIYYELVAVVQGVGISKVKGFHMETQNHDDILSSGNKGILPHTAEIAKRIFCSGSEITVVPTDEVFTSFESPIQMPDLLASLEKRGYPLPDDHILLPGLSSLCHHKKTALLLLTNPLVRAPSRVTRAGESSSPLDSLPWYKPGFDVEKFKLAFTKVLRGQITTVLLRVITSINKWFMLAISDSKTKVKSWSYESETQGLLVYLVAEKIRGTLDRAVSDKEIAKAFPEGEPVNWVSLKKLLGSFQVVFEVEHLFKENDISKHQELPRFVNSLILKVIKATLEAERAKEI
jgi:hypothetical protein